MLNIQFSVQGDANDKLVEIQAKGVVAALYSIYGDSVLPNVETLKVGDVSRTTTRPIGPDTRSKMEIIKEAVADGAAIDDARAAFEGNTAEYLAVHAEEEPDAAAAFGGVATPAPTGERDSAGIPWDARIHSSTKGTNKDGTWSRRRNTPDATFDAVMAELKAANTQRTVEAAQGAGLVPPPPATPAVPAPPPVPSAPSAPPAPAASSSAPAASGDLIDPASPTAFPDIMKKVTSAQAAGKITPEGVNNLVKSIGLESIAGLMANKALIPAFQALLNDHVAMQG